ncbi:MAG: ABC transporter permease [Clostridia bacterium]|nr:ABC transporter permease [Clostridia bacterium]
MNTLKKTFLRWEWLLVLLTIGVFLLFNQLNPDAYTVEKLMNQTRVYMVDVGFMALGALLILMLGDIDISVASTAGLAATVMGISYNGGNGVPFVVAIILALLVGAVCGAINGILVTRFKELFPMIITLSTQTIYRGINYIILKDQAVSSFPYWFGRLGYDQIDKFFPKELPGWINEGSFLEEIYNIIGAIPIMLICLLVVFPFFFLWIHKTPHGHRIFATGQNIVTARYSGIRTDRMKTILFMMNGILAAVGGVFLAARTGSVKYTHANGFEMQAIAVAVLSGASTAGGKGSVIGILLSLILMTCLKNGLYVVFNDSFIMNLAVGALLIAVVLIPNIAQMISDAVHVRRRRREAAKTAFEK